MMYECFVCGERAVVWDGDFDCEDYGFEEPGVVNTLHCTSCGAFIQCISFDDEGDER